MSDVITVQLASRETDCEDESLIVKESTVGISSDETDHLLTNQSQQHVSILSIILMLLLIASLAIIARLTTSMQLSATDVFDLVINSSSHIEPVIDPVDESAEEELISDPHIRSLIASIVPNNATANASSVCLNRFAGRFGNHLYQILTATKYATDHKLQLYLPQCQNSWMFPVQQPFQHPCPENEELQMFQDHGYDRSTKWTLVDPRTHTNTTNFHIRIDGYFQYHSSLYSDVHLDVMRAVLHPHPKLLKQLRAVHHQLLLDNCADSLIVGIHVRRGDFNEPGGSHSQIPTEWYIDWLLSMQHQHADVLQRAKRAQDVTCPACVEQVCQHPFNVSRLLIFLASDDKNVTKEFTQAHYDVVTGSQLQLREYDTFASLSDDVDAFYLDWWMLSQLNVIAASHSTFSLSSILLNRHVAGVDGFFYWPDSVAMAIQPIGASGFEYIPRDFYGKNFSTHSRYDPGWVIYTPVD